MRAAFDQVRAAFELFVKTEGDRIYQAYMDGTSRGTEAIAGEEAARRHFMATVVLVVEGPPARVVDRRSFVEADRALNAVYKKTLTDYARGEEPSQVIDFKTKSRAAQRAWVRYRDAMGKLAAARWVDVAGIEAQARAAVTDDRIRELGETGEP